MFNKLKKDNNKNQGCLDREIYNFNYVEYYNS